MVALSTWLPQRMRQSTGRLSHGAIAWDKFPVLGMSCNPLTWVQALGVSSEGVAPAHTRGAASDRLGQKPVIMTI